MSTAVSAPILFPPTAGAASELKTVERGIGAVLASDWAKLGVRGVSAVVVSELLALGFQPGPDEPRPYLLSDDAALEAFVLDSLVDSETGQLLTVRTSLRVNKTPGLVGESGVFCTVFRPGRTDTTRTWMAAMLVARCFAQTMPMLSTRVPDWFLPPEERDPDTGLNQSILSHVQALTMVGDAELARPAAAELARELLAKLSP